MSLTIRILKLCNPPQKIVNTYREMSGSFATRGFRSLGVAVKEGGNDWEVLGLLPMFDPPRRDTAAVCPAVSLSVRCLTLRFRRSLKHNISASE